MALLCAEDAEGGVLRETRDTPPAHYLFKVKYFSLLSEYGLDKFKSNKFKAGQHHWKILLFPKGNNEGNGDHVSIYLMLESTGSLPAGGDVHAIFKFFLFDQIRGKYMTVQGIARRFDRVKYKWGFAKFISLEAFKDPTNGFIVNDTCIFGVEIFVPESSCLGECLSVSGVDNLSVKYKWAINKFSELGEECYSDEFVAGGYKWKIYLYSEGCYEYKGLSLSLCLECVVDSTTEQNVKAKYTVTLYDQFNQNHILKTGTNWFGASNQNSVGFPLSN